MLPFAYYLLKVIICSAVLFGYYWCFLRNKAFHIYNRFYLLATIILSLAMPLLKFNIWHSSNTAKTSVVHLLQIVNNSDDYMDEIIIHSHYNNISKEQIAGWLFMAICFILAGLLLRSIIKIYALKKNNPRQQYENISLIITEDKSAPFSFLKNIFWNNAIDISSSNGRRILKHEIAHVHEKHSQDKLFTNIVLIIFWCNPIFWLLRKEINLIHEFLADKKAVEDGDTAAFAAMILQTTYPNHRFEITNNFFYSPIKRRLAMLTKNNKTKVSYISRLLVLPLTVIVFAAFTLKAKTYITSLPKDKTITVRRAARPWCAPARAARIFPSRHRRSHRAGRAPPADRRRAGRVDASARRRARRGPWSRSPPRSTRSCARVPPACRAGAAARRR